MEANIKNFLAGKSSLNRFMSYYKLFEIGLWKSAFNTDLKEYCYSIQKSDKGRIKTNVLGYQSNPLNIRDSILQPLIDHIEIETNKYIQSFLTYPKPMHVCNMWININGTNSYNKLHTHPQSFFSGVYYVSKPKDSGHITFTHPAYDSLEVYWPFISNQKEYTSTNSTEWTMYSKDGDCLIFPSFYKHYVEPNKSKEDRISISFNLK